MTMGQNAKIRGKLLVLHETNHSSGSLITSVIPTLILEYRTKINP